MSNRTISEVIRNQRILCADAGTTVRSAARLMAQEKVGAMMIVKSGQLTGIFTERDVLNRVVAPGLDPESTKLADVMTHDPKTVNADRLFSYAMHVMNEGGFRHLPVVEKGKPVGMISIRDALGPEMIAFESEREWRDALTEIIM